jgi:hypothetical protein
LTYRHGGSGSARNKSVGLIVEQVPVQRRVTDRAIVVVTIAWGEAALSAKAKSMGARWDKPSRLWRMSMRTARLLDVTERVQQTSP